MSGLPPTREEFNALNAEFEELLKRLYTMSQMGPPPAKGSHSSRSSDASGSGRERTPSQDSKKSINYCDASDCPIDRKMKIMEINNWNILNSRKVAIPKSRFGEMFKVDEKSVPEDLPDLIFNLLKKNFHHREKPSVLSEASLQSVFYTILLEICSAISTKLNLKPDSMPLISDQDGFSWVYAVQDKEGVRGRFDLSVYKLLPDLKHFPFLVIEMKTAEKFSTGRDQLLIYLKRNQEVDGDHVSDSNFKVEVNELNFYTHFLEQEVYGIVSDLANWQLICLTGGQVKISAKLVFLEDNIDFESPNTKTNWLDQNLLLIKVICTILQNKITKHVSLPNHS